MKRYSEYKDSGVEWIGEIPSHWQVKKIKLLTDILSCGLASTPEYVDEGIPFLSAQNVKNGKLYLSKYNNITPSLHRQLTKYKKAKKGDILQVRVGATIGNACIVDVDFDFSIYVSLTHIRCNSSMNNKFMKYILDSDLFKEIALLETFQGGGVGNLNVNVLEKIKLPVPDLNEQEKIANYLDKKTLQIENLIGKKEEIIETLKASRTKLISETVTKGLDKNVPMKDSGVEWIGEIPSHWKLSKLKFNTNKDFMYGANESGEDMQENQPRYIRITDINEDGNLKNDTYVTLDYKKAKPYILEDKDILFARSGATVGKTFLYNKSDCDLACFAGYLIKFTANKNKCNPEYIYYYTQSKMYEEFININISQATIQNVSAEKYKNLYNPLPPLEEQDSIVKYLDNKISKIKKLITKVEEQIELLKKAKQKLITEVVTGKIDVTDM
ncbi:restriction endonuclease subunit S [Paraclostridium bifermentans]|uniref:restriction endonuclease subunit S n=1 Tax=Paraclostridium bifermentans TaxID=1490 RepID=UPI001C117D47|nr:restriction endonuclease subunit S [Paraclostridium bifermentans]MBU5288281.1 restriction endonuclease subunit S [Paraclostridium bifermentans]